jgi:hypothetical protein
MRRFSASIIVGVHHSTARNKRKKESCNFLLQQFLLRCKHQKNQSNFNFVVEPNLTIFMLKIIRSQSLFSQ